MKSLITSALLLAFAIAGSSFVLSTQRLEKNIVNANGPGGPLRAHRQGKDIALTWSAAGGNIARYHVERSYDGEMFELIDQVENTGASVYRFKDLEVPPGYLYYRICSIDAGNNIISVSPVEVVRIVQRK